MRVALVAVPSDPACGSSNACREALAWLEAELARRGFQVALLGDGTEPWAEVERALLGISPGDSVLVIASGRVVAPDALAFGDAWWMPLGTVSEWLAAREAIDVSFVLELLHDGPADDSLFAAQVLGDAVAAMGARSRGHAVLAATRARVLGADRLAFTRLALPAVHETGAEPTTQALVAAMHARASGSPEAQAVAQSFTFARVASTSAPPPDRRVEVRRRLAAVGSLGSASMQARELVAIARILQSELGDASGAIQVLERAHGLDPAWGGVRDALRRGYERTGQWDRAFALHVAEGRTDEAFLAAMALEQLGAATPEHRAAIDRGRTAGAIRARGTLDAAAWARMAAPGSDEILSSIFAAAGRAGIAARVEDLRARRELVRLDESRRLGDETTVSVVRTLHWAARVLGVDCPALYVAGGGTEGISTVLGPQPALELGPAVMSGRTSKELAFLAGKHLAAFRPDVRVLAYFPTREALQTLLFAAVEAVMTGATPAGAGQEVPALSAELVRRLEPEEMASLDLAVRQLDRRGGKVAIGAWIRAAQLTAARAGLLLCGDLQTAMAFEASQGSDLVAFCASRAHASLRARFVERPRGETAGEGPRSTSRRFPPASRPAALGS
jgi:hypothetical protein